MGGYQRGARAAQVPDAAATGETSGPRWVGGEGGGRRGEGVGPVGEVRVCVRRGFGKGEGAGQARVWERRGCEGGEGVGKAKVWERRRCGEGEGVGLWVLQECSGIGNESVGVMKV